ISREDQHALRVDRAAELDLALNVDDLPVADAHVRRDAGRLAEMKAAEPQNRQPVDLADLRARRVDQEVVALDLLLELLAQTIDSPDLSVDGFFHVAALNELRAFPLGPEARFATEVRDFPVARRELLGVADQACRVL